MRGEIVLEGLRDEHKSTRYILYLLNMAATRWEAGEPITIGLFIQSAVILQKYAEDFHQNLEEELLFPLMERDGVPWCGGPLEVLQHEHRECRRYMEDLQAALNLTRHQKPAAKEEIIENIKAYTHLLKAHMDKEEMVVFPIAERLLRESDVLAGDYTRMSAHSEWVEEHRQLIEALEKELGISGRLEWEATPEHQTEKAEHLAEEFLRRGR